MIRAKSGFCEPWLLGVVAFQLAAFGAFGPNVQGDNLSAHRLLGLFSQSNVRAGYSLPAFAAYRQSGVREGAFVQNRLTTLVFQDDCSCETEQVDRLVESTRKRNEDVVIMVDTRPDDLPRFYRKGIPPSRVLAIRQTELTRLGISGRRLPVAVFVGATGTVVSIQDNPLQAS